MANVVADTLSHRAMTDLRVESGDTVDFRLNSKEILRFGRKGKFSLRLDQIQDVFHVSKLRHYHSDPAHVISVEEIEVRPDLTFEDETVQILDCDLKVLRTKSIPLVKVLWHNHNSEEATWELEEAMHQQYPHLF
ncbi:uncharacterized protein [Gossypium hirsutum]|uniref:Chromo domain-containing protein n=1 Tax=Gossypium hirsutum TaxID=3635 RepID=A0A1U8IDV5_GOSHI|nr:uncharacterized protein LOC107895638 [Gossypium hirsutum]